MSPLISIAKDLVALSSGLGRGEVQDEDRIQELIGRILSLPHVPTEPLASLQERADHLSSEDSKTLQNIFARSLGRDTLPSLPDDLQQEVCKAALPLIASVEEDAEIPFLLEILSQIDPEKRPEWISIAKRLLETISDPRKQMAILELLAKIPTSSYSLVLRFYEPSLSYEDRQTFLTHIIHLEEIPSFTGENQLKDLIGFLAPKDRMALLTALSFVPKALYERVCLKAIDLARPTENIAVDPFRVIQEVLTENPGEVENVHRFLFKELNETRDGKRARHLSQGITSHLTQLHVPLPGSLEQKAYEILSASDPNKPQNPYTVYATLKSREKQPRPAVKPAAAGLTSEYYSLDPAKIAEQKPVTIKRSDLPPVNREMLEGMWTAIANRLHILNAADRTQVERYIEDSTGMSFTHIKNDLMGDHYIFGLFQIPEDPQAPHVDTAYLYAIIQYARSLPNQLEPGQLLSPQEEYLTRVFASIQGCPAGRSGGIVAAYNCLPLEWRYANQAEASFRSHRDAQAFLLKTLANSIGTILENPGPLMQAWAGDRSPAQLSHYSTYIKNNIARFIGIAHNIEFDLYTGILPSSLVDKSLQELLQIFYQHYTAKDLSIALQQQLRLLPVEEQKKVCESIQALCQELLPESIPGNEEEDPSELLYNVAYTDETYETVQEYSLTDKGSISLLRATGLIEKTFSKEDHAFELLLRAQECFASGDSTQALKLFEQLPPSFQNKVFEGVYAVAKHARIIRDPIDPHYGKHAFYGTEGMSIPDDIKKLGIQWALLSLSAEMLPDKQALVDLICSYLPHNLQVLLGTDLHPADSASLRSSRNSIHLLRFLQKNLNHEALETFLVEISSIPEQERRAFSLVFPFIQQYTPSDRRKILEIFRDLPENQIEKMAKEFDALLSTHLLRSGSRPSLEQVVDAINRCSSEDRLSFVEDANMARTDSMYHLNMLLDVPAWMRRDFCKLRQIGANCSHDDLTSIYRTEKDKKIAEGLSLEDADAAAKEEFHHLVAIAVRVAWETPSENGKWLLDIIQAVPAHEREDMASDLILCLYKRQGNTRNVFIVRTLIEGEPSERQAAIRCWAQAIQENRMSQLEILRVLRTIYDQPQLKRRSLECLQAAIVCVSHGMMQEEAIEWIKSYLLSHPKEDLAALSRIVPLICKSSDPNTRKELLKQCLKAPLHILISHRELLERFSEKARIGALCLLASNTSNANALRSFLLAAKNEFSIDLPNDLYSLSAVLSESFINSLWDDSSRMALFSLLPPSAQNRIYYHMYAIAREEGEDTSNPRFGEDAFHLKTNNIHQRMTMMLRRPEAIMRALNEI